MKTRQWLFFMTHNTRTKMKKLKYFIFPVVLLVVFFFVFSGTKMFRSFFQTKKEYDYLSLFSQVIALVKTDYVEQIQPPEKFPGAFSGMLSALDETSAYLDSKQSKIYNLYLQNNVYNCGIYGTRYSNYFYITDMVKNSTASTCKIKPGCIIKSVNGKSIYGQSFWQMYLSLLADKPETIELVLLEENSSKPCKVNVQTEPPKDTPIFKKIREDIYLVKLPRIDKERVTTLTRQLAAEQGHRSGSNPLKLIIDLRKYNGGDLDSFIQLTKLFFNETIPLKLTLKTKSGEEIFSLGSNHAFTYRAVVIINKSTRMYGELLANLFKISRHPDTPVGTLVGTETAGFISKLKQVPLKDGSSILLPEGLFLLNGKNPGKSTVKPDVKIKDEDFAAIIDRSISILNR
jgi:carboxyl-terminal processing protease